MRYGPERKKQTRARILDAAAKLFRERGYEGTGIDAIVAAAGLTPGAFYAHFVSKESLLIATLRRSLTEGSHRLAHAAATSKDPVRALAERYLTCGHRDDPGAGCPLPCLAPEIARLSPAARRAFGRAFERYLADVTRALGEGSARVRGRRRVLATLSSMVGAMTIARAVADAGLSEEILASARHALRSAPPRRRRTVSRTRSPKP